MPNICANCGVVGKEMKKGKWGQSQYWEEVTLCPKCLKKLDAWKRNPTFRVGRI